jgi:two-component system phosphate regulon sensor histidine kinase PhoR
VRRLLLVNALIFAVLAAAVALAYYGYGYRTEQALAESDATLIQDLAGEKVYSVESKIVDADDALLRSVEIDQLDKLPEQVRNNGVAISSVFVLDDQLKVWPGGTASVDDDPKRAVANRDWYVANVIPKLALPKNKLGERGHYYDRHAELPFLLAYAKKQVDGRTFYVIVERSVNRLVDYFDASHAFESTKKLLYQVVDENGRFRYGVEFIYENGVAVPFVDTLDGPRGAWRLRVTDAEPPAEPELRHQHAVDSVLIGGAVTIVLAGLAFLALAIRRERRANELKSDFISNVSHELKTPLSIITMFGEMLANGRTKSPEQATEYAEIIYREGVRLDRLIENVLDFAKIERGMGVYEFAEADLAEVVTRAVDLAARRLQTAEMTIDVDLEAELPLVKLDANAVTLAVLNLIDNAIKYASSGKRVALTLKRDDHRVVLSVRDWGPGIEREEQARIFERFYRAKAMRLKPIRGSGIGLALVQHIARAHGGDVSVTSASGEGATFQLWLPI